MRRPVDGEFSGTATKGLAEGVHIDILREEAKEYGIISDDAADATEMPQEILDILGVSAEEVRI